MWGSDKVQSPFKERVKKKTKFLSFSMRKSLEKRSFLTFSIRKSVRKTNFIIFSIKGCKLIHAWRYYWLL